MLIGNKEIDTSVTNIMGILNVTPDSFSDGGRFVTMDKLLFHAEQMVEDGATIIDVGGESTRPGYTMISSHEEIARVVPAIEAIKQRIDIPISVDTYKADVAEAAICAGASMVNDIWGLDYDVRMRNIVARYDVACAITHNRKSSQYNELIEDVKSELKDLADKAIAAGIDKSKIILDVGIGFAKDSDQNLKVVNHLADFNELGFPILLGASKKSFIGNALNLPVNERVEGTLMTTAHACYSGCAFVRVHDVKENKRIIDMYNKIINA